jgi:hypothetical protein
MGMLISTWGSSAWSSSAGAWQVPLLMLMLNMVVGRWAHATHGESDSQCGSSC